MKAVICTKYGKPEVLRMEEIEKPSPKPFELLVKIYATAVTSSDCIVRSFNLPLAMRLPARLALGITKPRKPILGIVLSGVVEKVGRGIRHFKEGNKVYAHTLTRFGAYAEYAAVPVNSAITMMPDNTSFEEAAAIPFGGTLALFCLQKANVSKGQKVLIYGASGAVGTSSVQMAKYYGAHVTGVCSTSNIELVKSLGADKVIDYTKENIAANGHDYDIIFDAIGKRKSGHVQFNNMLAPHGKLMSVDDGNPMERAVCKDNMLALKDLVETGKLKPVIDKIYPLEQIVDAHRYVDKGHKKGNVIIKV